MSSLSYTHLHFLVISKCESRLSGTATAEGALQNYIVITHLNLRKLSSQVALSNLVSSWTALMVHWNHLVLTALIWLTSVTGDFLISLHDKSLLTDLGSSNLSSILVFENNQQNAFRLNYLATIKPHIFCPDVLLLAKQALGSTFARNWRFQISKLDMPNIKWACQCNTLPLFLFLSPSPSILHTLITVLHCLVKP